MLDVLLKSLLAWNTPLFHYTHCVRKVYHFTILSAIISYYIPLNIQIQISVNI